MLVEVYPHVKVPEVGDWLEVGCHGTVQVVTVFAGGERLLVRPMGKVTTRMVSRAPLGCWVRVR